ncbi:hypothetical protein U1E44_03760 [Arenibacter sp. GZD96]|uniref:hypothetical protein n=1 Tax=Aurantibrevibacter litoralis TaxID=3106030 RepID=UPI002AFEAF59|nr:hypothetical protein [Arenibacter sp. GZD-96]MEA1785195.1 hypothetical protein [Arenibacter sp. GZD-96]
MKKIGMLLAVVLCGCASSTRLVQNWKNPDIVLFHANKVLIVGMIQNPENRERFETQLVQEFTARGVDAMRSIDLFDVEFTLSAKTEEEVARVEEQLLAKDFDAILVTKVVGSESAKTLGKRIAELENLTGKFKEDYLHHQDIYYDSDYYGKYKLYHTETSLYCICVAKEEELIWQAAIDIPDPKNVEKSMNSYIDLLVATLKAQDLVFISDHKYKM